MGGLTPFVTARLFFSCSPAVCKNFAGNCALKQLFHLKVIGIHENVVPLYKQMIEAMIRSIPNPPMDREDVARFRRNLEKHLRGDFSAEERQRIEEQKARTESITQRIIANCGGKNPILGY